MAEAEVVHLESERQKAERYKAAVIQTLQPVLALMEDAKRDGLLIEFGLGFDHYGRAAVATCAIVKRY